MVQQGMRRMVFVCLQPIPSDSFRDSFHTCPTCENCTRVALFVPIYVAYDRIATYISSRIISAPIYI